METGWNKQTKTSFFMLNIGNLWTLSIDWKQLQVNEARQLSSQVTILTPKKQKQQQKNQTNKQKQVSSCPHRELWTL